MTVRHGRRPDRPRRRAPIRRIAVVSAPEPAPGPALASGAAESAAGEAAAIAETTPDVVPGAPSGSGPDAVQSRITPLAMLVFARETYNIRRRRERFLPTDLFGEPTWDILLDLYVATRENRPVPTTSACIGAHVPPTTALRWLRILEARGLVEREDDGRDGRRTFVRLSARGLAAMEDWLHASLATLDHTVGVIMRHGTATGGPLAEAAE